MIEYALTRSKRKTMALYIRNGNLEVRAPLNMPRRDIDRFVASKERWISDKLAKSREQSEWKEAFELAYGDKITLRGTEYVITARDGKQALFDGEAFYLPPGLTSEQIKAACIQMYRYLAKAYLKERVSFYAKHMGLAAPSVKISAAKTRWGSCSSKGNINFSWRLIVADDSLIDYVVVHELAHLIEMNHSARFWSAVKGVLPDYRERQALLRKIQDKFNSENWD